jgi:hypothetical protein
LPVLFHRPPSEPDLILSHHPALQKIIFVSNYAQDRFGITHLAHLSTWSSIFLLPFAMYAAFPRSDYYGSSVTMGLASFR